MIYNHSNKCLYKLLKRAADILFSAVSLILFTPLILIAAAAICIESKGNPFYKHERVGYLGKKFMIYKLRSMYVTDRPIQELLSPEQLEELNTEYKLRDDPRITKVGRFIRKSSIDELPQLINILKGDMSIVGPRPLVENELLHYGDDRDKLLSIRPGLTGYWQAYARNDATYASGKRQSMELYYIDNCSLPFDLKILFKTVGAVIRKSGH